MNDLRTDIRTAFEKEQAVSRPAPTLRDDLVAVVGTRPRRAPSYQWLAVAAALLLAVLVVAGLMSTRLANRPIVPVAPLASPSAAASASPSPSPSLPAASPTPMSVAAADALVRSTVTGAHPLLLPTAIQASWSAVVSNVDQSSFTITYTSPDGSKSVMFSIQVPNPPPPGPHGSQSNPRFHGDVHSLYQVDDATAATSSRFLIWNEPGTWSQPNGLPGVPYFMSTEGLTDAEFWTIANSVHA